MAFSMLRADAVKRRYLVEALPMTKEEQTGPLVQISESCPVARAS